MLASLNASLQPPNIPAYEMEQRRTVLARLLWIMLALALTIGLIDLRLEAATESITLFVAAAIAILAMLLNRRGHYVVAGVMASVMVLVAIDIPIYESGGILDPAVIAIPLFVMLGPLLFSRRVLPYYLLAALLSVIALGVLDLQRESPAMSVGIVAHIAVICLLTLGSGLMAWVTIGNLEENVLRARESQSGLREAYERTLEGWSRALDRRDQQTHSHSLRVVDLCMRLAREWPFSEDDLAHIRHGALLHDIGKMGIPDRILLKQGPLTPRERKLMQQHPEVAISLLSDIPYLQPALNIPAAHHEHWDGTGYPRGLKGARIPIEARIFAVVDTFDALSSNRPYRKAWPTGKALSYIEQNSGRLFDPAVCAAFIRLYKTKAFGAAV